jgi:hypothetical protein
MKQKYLSHSTLQRTHQCKRKEFYKRNPKEYPPFKRTAAMVKGRAIHEAISSLHDNPLGIDPIAEFNGALDRVEFDSNVPVDWGKMGRDWHVKQGQSIIEWYWKVCGPDGIEPLDVRSTERWFFVPLEMPDGTVEWIRGRFDLLLGISGGLGLQENKTGAKPDIESLQFDPQCLLQAYAIRYGYIALGDPAYIGPDDEKYHIHEWEHVKDKLYKCTVCELEAEHFGVLPSKVLLYHVPSVQPDFKRYCWKRFKPEIVPKESSLIEKLEGGTEIHDLVHRPDMFKCPYCEKPVLVNAELHPECGTRFKTEEKPLKTKTRTDYYHHPPYEPRDNPEYLIEFTRENLDGLIQYLQDSILEYRACEKSGKWPQTKATSFMSPCRICEFKQHCQDKQICSVVHEGVNGDED